MKSRICVAVLAIGLFAMSSYADWSLWVIPEKREVKPYESLRFNFGVSGGGNQRPQDFKVTIYSELDSQLRPLKGDAEYEMYAFTFKKDAPVDMFTKTDPRDPQGLIREAEGSTPFSSMFVTPESPGEKTVTLILTYKTEENRWATSSTQFHYHVPTRTERNQWWITAVATLGVLVGIWKDALSKGLKWIRRRKCQPEN